ncbi:UNVERIFIED_CONTAM: hypothetical protein FKN15_031955 [Acipenser sinensis]
MECTTLSREGAGLAKPPKHLWRQPRTHIRIKQRYHSDTERYCKSVEKCRPGLKKPRMSWPSSFHKRKSHYLKKNYEDTNSEKHSFNRKCSMEKTTRNASFIVTNAMKKCH